MRDEQRTTNKQTVKIELLSQWKLEAEFRKNPVSTTPDFLNNLVCQWLSGLRVLECNDTVNLN